MTALQAELAHLAPNADKAGSGSAAQESESRVLAELALVREAVAKQGEQVEAAFAAAKSAAERKQLRGREDLVELLKEQQEKLEAGLKDQFKALSQELTTTLRSELKQAVGEMHKGFAQLSKEVKAGQSAVSKELVRTVNRSLS
jgi:hypothetical protein